MPSTLRHASHSWFPCRDTPQSQTERSATILQPSCGQGACVNACSPAQDLSTARQQAAQWQQLKWTPPSTLSTKQLLEHATETLLISCAPCILSRRSSLPYLRTCAQDAFQNALAGRYQSSSLLSSLSSSSSFRIFHAARALPCYKPTPIACRFCSKQRARKTLGADCAA